MTSQEDSLLFFQVAERGRICFLEDVLIRYRVHGAQWNASATGADKAVLGLRMFLILLRRATSANQGVVSSMVVSVGLGNVLRWCLSWASFKPRSLATALGMILTSRDLALRWKFCALGLVGKKLARPVLKHVWPRKHDAP